MAKQVKVVTDGDIGAGLKIEAGKLLVAVDGSTIKIEGNQLVAVQPEAKVDLHVTKIEGVGGKLVVTVSDAEGGNSQTVETSLASLIALSATEGNLATAEADGIFVGKAKIEEVAKEAVKAEATLEFQTLGGTVLGHAFEARDPNAGGL